LNETDAIIDRRAAPGDVRGSISGAIVNYDAFPLPERLCLNAIDRCREEALHIAHRNYDTDKW
jgi:hypothetical protein